MRLYERFLRKAPKQSRSRSVVEAVLDAAAELLPGNDADDAVTLNDIATRAGVGVGSLYDYFADRGSVLSGLVAKVTEDNLRRFEKQLEESRDKPLEVAVREIIDLMFDTYAGDVRIPRAVL
jgi:AcrR family transcriptional regulator